MKTKAAFDVRQRRLCVFRMIGVLTHDIRESNHQRLGVLGRVKNGIPAEMGLDFVELKATDSGYSLYKNIGFEDVVSKYQPMKFVIASGSITR
ncbi:MAG: hypothetical protein ACI3XG_05890 [Faecousia sp.]